MRPPERDGAPGVASAFTAAHQAEPSGILGFMGIPGVESAYGYLLVTADPALESGRTGSAWELVRARLDSGLWPIYKNTRYRAAMQSPGTRLAFYVGGQRENAGAVMATALVEKVVPATRVPRPVDPARFLTDAPHITLVLRNVRTIIKPVMFKDVLPQLSIKPPARGSWGIVLQGGARALTERDWLLLVNSAPI
jgi:hypothetical protein